MTHSAAHARSVLHTARTACAVVVVAALGAVGCDVDDDGDPPRGRAVLALLDAEGNELCGDVDDAVIDDCVWRFGAVDVGAEAAAVIVVENRGDAPLTVPRYSFSQTAPGFSLGDDLVRALAPGERAGFTLLFAPKEVGAQRGRLVLDDGDEDVAGDIVLDFDGEGRACEGFGVVRVVAIDDVAVDDDAGDVVFVGDVLDLAADAAPCSPGATFVSVTWSLDEPTPASVLEPQGARARLVLRGAVTVRVVAVASDGVAYSATRVFSPRAAQSFTVLGAGVHLARDSLSWCGDDDCYAGHCDVGWGVRGEAPDVDDNSVGLRRASDGRYTVALPADEDGQLLARAFVDGQLAAEVLRAAPPGEPHIVMQLQVVGGVVDVIVADDTGPQPGACFE